MSAISAARAEAHRPERVRGGMTVEGKHHLVIAGASGVVGTGALEHFAGLPGWRVTAVSRRPPVVGAACRFDHCPADLADRDATARAMAALPPVTHLIYAAAAEAPGLVAGWQDADLIAANGAMFANLLDPLAARGSLLHVTLLQGTKAYGGHRHPVTIPAREDGPRDDHANFYWLQEDHARASQQKGGFALTIFRPQVLMGHAPGSAMNPVAALGAYAAVCAERGDCFTCPAEAASAWEMVDTGLFAEACAWAAATPAAHGQIFNVTNGDVLVLQHAWPHLAQVLGLAAEGPPRGSLVAYLAEPESEAAWARLHARHGLRSATLPALLGQSAAYLDLLTSPRAAARPVPVLLSTIKLRQAGFAACRDSEASLLHWLGRMVALSLLPPIGPFTAAA